MNPRSPSRAAKRRGVEPPRESVVAACGSGVVRRPWRVLLVDDDDDSRSLCADYMTTMGYEILEAPNGAEAIATTLRRKPDLIVMDLEMPVMGGLEAIERLRTGAATRAIPILVLSGNTVSDHAKVKRAGCDTCLVKPCRLDDLEGIVRAVLDDSEDHAASGV